MPERDSNMSDFTDEADDEGGGVTPRSRIDDGEGYLGLGSIEEAEENFSAVPSSDDSYPMAQAHLVQIDFLLGRFDAAIDRSVGLMQEYGVDLDCMRVMANCMLYERRYDQARQALDVVRKRSSWTYWDAYALACIETQRGRCAEALHWLRTSLELSDELAIFSLMDPHLAFLWRWVGSGSVHSVPEVAVDLDACVFSELIVKARAHREVISVDHETVRIMPRAFQRIVRIDAGESAFVVNYVAAARTPGVKKAYLRWQRRRILKSVACLEGGREAPEISEEEEGSLEECDWIQYSRN
jgi:tetratricopeptide (TPR) repeat protein